MRRLVPHPWLSAVLFVLWLALASSVAPLHLAAAALLAIAVPIVAHPFLGPPAALRRPHAIVPLALVVLRDVVVANLVVARLIVFPGRTLQPAFLEVPLDTRHPQVLALLASIVTMTPGTVSVDVDAEDRCLLVNALDVADAAGAVADIKSRYERPLMRIFGADPE